MSVTVAQLHARLREVEQQAAQVPELAQAAEQARQLAREATERAAAGQPVVVAPWATVRKALVAVLTAGVGSLAAALSDGSVTTTESLTALGVGLLAGLAVYRVPNATA